MDLTRQLAAIDDARERLVVAASSPDVPVPTCPGWTVADLAWHVGIVGDIWRQLVEGSLTEARDFRPGDRPDPGSLPAWLDAALKRLSAGLADADPSATVPTWADPVTAGFVQRRLTHELTMHAWDADRAFDRAQPIPTDLAEDGIDELLGALAFFRVPVPERFAAGEGIHLHCTDEDLPEGAGEWVVSGRDRTWSVERRHAKEAFAARGPASDLLLTLWGRAPVEDLATFGDRALLDDLITGLRDSTSGRRR